MEIKKKKKAAAMGGVTSAINYVRSGQYYLNQGGSYKPFVERLFKLSEGNYWVDYAFHLAPIESRHIKEMEMLVREYGIISFKVNNIYIIYIFPFCNVNT